MRPKLLAANVHIVRYAYTASRHQQLPLDSNIIQSLFGLYQFCRFLSRSPGNRTAAPRKLTTFGCFSCCTTCSSSFTSRKICGKACSHSKTSQRKIFRQENFLFCFPVLFQWAAGWRMQKLYPFRIFIDKVLRWDYILFLVWAQNSPCQCRPWHIWQQLSSHEIGLFQCFQRHLHRFAVRPGCRLQGANGVEACKIQKETFWLTKSHWKARTSCNRQTECIDCVADIP